jgi:hypothetical protein
MIVNSSTSTPKTGPRSIAEAATDVARGPQGGLSEMETKEPSFFLCGCDSDGTSHEHRLAEAAQEGGHGVRRVATIVAQAMKETVQKMLFRANAKEVAIGGQSFRDRCHR